MERNKTTKGIWGKRGVEMEYQHKLLLVAAALIVAALYIASTIPGEEPPPDRSGAEALLLRGAEFGKGMGDYVYSYSEVSDGYKTTYVLASAADGKSAEVRNPLSTKRVYLLENDTVFCIAYPANETCSSVQGNSEMQNYVDFIRSKFFNDTIIARGRNNIEYLLGRGYLTVEAEVENATVGTFECARVAYRIDYSNLSLQEAAQFSIASNSPKVFDLTMCVGEDGVPYETTLEYQDKDVTHYKVTRVSSLASGPASVGAPQDLSGDAVGVFRKEREQQVSLAKCHTDKTGEEREKCVSDIALTLRRKDLCELADTRRDRCLVALVPLTKDTTICTAVSDASFRDDCYVELAGAFKDASYCGSVADQSKTELCQSAAKPKEQNGSSVDIDKFIDQVDQS